MDLVPESNTNVAEEDTRINKDDVPSLQGEPAKKRRRYNSRKTLAEWDMIKADVKRLYVDEDFSLDETMSDLQVIRGFEASKDQFKSKIKAWGFDKKVKTQEMKHLVRISNSRLPKKTSFTVRKQPVSKEKVERFTTRHSAFPEPLSRTPSVISYRTSYSPEDTTSSLASNVVVSPRLEVFDRYRRYEDQRNNTPVCECSVQHILNLLQQWRIQKDEWKPRTFTKLNFLTSKSNTSVENIFRRNPLQEEMEQHILHGRFTIGMTLLRAIIIAAFDRHFVPSPMRGDDSYGMLLWRRATSQIGVFRWILDLRYKPSGNHDVVKISPSTCGGLQANNIHLCWNKSCPGHLGHFLGGENFNREYNVTRHFVDRLDITEAICHIIRILLDLYSCYLPYLKESISALMISISEKQQKMQKERGVNTENRGERMPAARQRFMSRDHDWMNDFSSTAPAPEEYFTAMEQEELDWGHVGSQEVPHAAYKGTAVSSYHPTGPQLGGFDVATEYPDIGSLVETGMDPFPEDLRFTEQWNSPHFE